MKTLPVLAIITAAIVVPVAAQENVEGERPASWRVRFDRPNADASSLAFVTMTPGWHITTGPAGILYDPANTANGNYRLESEIFLFPTNGRDREAFGIIFGGRNLDGDAQAYTYFLIRNSGSFIIKRRYGGNTSTVVPWTDSDAVVKQSGDQTGKNVLAVEVAGGEVSFFINDQKVASVPRGEVDVGGIFGLRANHSINMHVSSLTATQSTGQ